MIVKIVNVVATAILDATIDPKELSRSSTNVAYNAEKYHCAYFRTSKMHGTVSIFPSGKMISIGARSEKNAKRNLIYVAKELEKKGFGKLKENSTKIQNIVLTVDIEKEIYLESLVTSLRGAIYEPHEFPGLITSHKGITYLIFHSGKIVCVGLKTTAQVQEVTHFLRTLPTYE